MSGTIQRWRLCVFVSVAVFASSLSSANPYYDESKVPHDGSYGRILPLPRLNDPRNLRGRAEKGIEVLRVSVSVDLKTERYSVAGIVREDSGTEALLRRARRHSPWGSYRAVLKDAETGEALFYDSIGTGREFRKLTDRLTFRFPLPERSATLEVEAENPESGKMEKVLTHTFTPGLIAKSEAQLKDITDLEIRELKRPTAAGPALRVNFYGDGYTAKSKSDFWSHAKKAVEALVQNRFPLVERMHFFAVYAPSTEKLGTAKNLGLPVQERNSFLGLYYPYWDNFGRWYHVVYPTREERFRQSLALAPYDYPIVLMDSGEYWGVGNFREHTAIPSRNGSFIYLLMHEFGHFFGLNEEYEGGGRTELEFAAGIEEPWSQNITFLKSTEHDALKWAKYVDASTPLPTPGGYWNPGKGNYGAYDGGYADSEPAGRSHKPGHSCVMERAPDFCAICKGALEEVIRFDLGE